MKIKETSMVEQAYLKIKEEIETFRFQPGSRLIIRELSEKFNIGETPIKQALNRLISEGLIDVFPNKGMAVKQFTWESYCNNLEARRMVETYCVPFAIQKAGEQPAFRERSMEIFARHKETFSTASNDDSMKNYLKISDIESEFHKNIVYCCDNEKIIDFYNRLGPNIYLLYYTFALNVQIRLQESLQEHEAILKALLSGDQEGMTTATNLHIDNTIKHMKTHSFMFYQNR